MEEEQKEEVFQTPTQFESRLDRSNSSASGPKKYLVIVAALVVVALLIFGVWKFLGKSKSSTSDVTPTPTESLLPSDTPTPTEVTGTPSPTETNTPTPKPTVNPIDKASGLDRSKLSIHVENGSGVAGAAKKASDFLSGLGYNVVQVGNADNTNYTQTVIQISSGSSSYLSLLTKDLSANYTLGSTSDSPPASESANAVVIIGTQ